MLTYWVLAPLLLLALAIGCGLLVEHVSGIGLDGVQIPGVGFATIIVTCVLATMTTVTVPLAAPLVVAFAVCGYGLNDRWRRPTVDRWAVGAAVAVYAIYAAPIVASGHATYSGFIALDDSATWFALAAHMFEHGRSLAGLPASTYEAVLSDNLPSGYPLGAFAILGLGGKLTGLNLAWLFQPVIALIGSSLALAIYAACGRLVVARPLRALVAFVGAQPALLFSYAFWSGIKEMTTAFLVALMCGLLAATIDRWNSVRPMLPTAIAMAAILAVLGVPGAIWLVVPGLVAAAFLARRGRLLHAARRLVPLVAVLSLASLLTAHAFLAGAAGGDATSSTEVANLGHPLNALQILGIWPARDFRVNPTNASLTHVLFVVVGLGVAAAAALAWRRRSWALVLFLGTGLVGYGIGVALKHVGLSSPWLNAKAMAEASPAFAATAMAGAAAVFETGRRTEAALAGLALAGGVLWSNVLGYSGVWLAPRSQLSELQTIGRRFAGDGPTLMTEYLPVGARYFLRDMAPEGASERRSRVDPLLSGRDLPPEAYADLDAFQLGPVLAYRTLVLRTSPVESRPPSVYELVWRSRFYEVWERPASAAPILQHQPLGNPLDPAAIPSCASVLALGRLARKDNAVLATVFRPAAPIVVDLSRGVYPSSWSTPAGEPGQVTPSGTGTLSVTVRVPTAARYSLWLGGSFRRTVTTTLDGRRFVGSVSDQLNNSEQWTPLGSAAIGPGVHTIALDYGGSSLTPGADGYPFPIGPLVLSATTADLPVTYLSPANARELCGKRLDWIEAVGA